ncbi:anti-sigma factor family protein [Plasticicumulans acidivorans]|uniref:Anti-sigma factor RsiW n=1 Tax=Plasticicumulans acidivorans TaxID=886464 RepID=A0A317MVU3_9GAMM|nr:anti-sigma factor [Plasticicumulans acidivorans]PWV58736.1 anti-sigma factor RsiW [Plasticicumulans acidivorans]
MNDDTPRAPLDEHDRLLLQAELDGELDTAGSLELARRLAARPALRAEAERLRALQQALQSLPPATASPALHARLGEFLPPAAPPAARRARRQPWPALAASAVLGALLAGTASWLSFAPRSGDDWIEAAAAGHRRALLSQHTLDVASSDRHTVKPWLSSRLGIAPTVIDLAAAGYPLLGARIEVIGGQAVPTLVYGHREHMISLSLRPLSSGATDDATPQLTPVAGYAVLSWREHGLAHLAVSDIDRTGLEDFVSRYRAAERSGGSGEAAAHQ